jgi:hypothetical protein
MEGSYGVNSIAYLRRARIRLDEGTQESLFYAALELRSGTESRLQQYLDGREDIAMHKKQGWKIVGSAKELDRAVRLGDRVYEVGFLDERGDTKMAAYYTPISTRLREAAGGRLHDLLHARKNAFPEADVWWTDTRAFLEQIYSDLEFASKGTLLGPLLRAPDGKSFHMTLSIHNDSPVATTLPHFSKVGIDYTVAVRYFDSLPDYATPFLNPTSAANLECS